VDSIVYSTHLDMGIFLKGWGDIAGRE